MCGIFALLNDAGLFAWDHIDRKFKSGARRGPENSTLCPLDGVTTLGFHRLAINGLTEASNQPLQIDGVTLICNGEIYNYKQLYDLLGVSPRTGSDCEVIIHMYARYGMDYTLKMLDGVFAFVLVDHKSLFVGRDPFGVRPLYHLKPCDKPGYHVEGFSSTLDCLDGLTSVINDKEEIEQFQPGTYRRYWFSDSNRWIFDSTVRYHSIGEMSFPSATTHQDACRVVRSSLETAVKKRVTTTERPIACLLSGGLDSSLVAALVSRFYDGTLETYSIGLEGGEDLKFARLVAAHIGSKHTEVVLSEDDFFGAIEEVVSRIESYDTTTVRASVGNYLIGKHIAAHSDAKVIFNGDGSDEVAGGYMYFHAAPDKLSFDAECRRLLQRIHYFDVLRSDRCISNHGLEPRTPFLDRGFVQAYLSIPVEFRVPQAGQREKTLIREAFDDPEDPLLPESVLWRQKEAFSDGVSKSDRSWYSIIDEKIKERWGNTELNPKEYHRGIHNEPKTREQVLYRSLFRHRYSQDRIIPEFWMPRFVDAMDSSARTLAVYKTCS
jgi:asparagine synthase (glutamine-hydrolysing)